MVINELPPPSEWMRVGQLEKQAVLRQDHSWQQRRVVLTCDELLFTLVNSVEVVQAIPLHEISAVLAEQHHVFAGCEFGIGKPQGAASQLPAVSAADWVNPDESLGERNLRVIRIRKVDAYSRTRDTMVRASAGACSEWQVAIQKQAKEAVQRRKEAERKSVFEKIQAVAHSIYGRKEVEFVVGFFIVMNFVNTIVEHELFVEADFQGSDHQRIMEVFELFFTWVFAVELLLNLVANMWHDFMNNGWSLFDAVVVPLTFVAQYYPTIPGVGVLRLLRVLRVLKLFQRLRSLRVIIHALIKSIVPVANAFLVLILVTAIYAVVATMFFHEYDNVQFGKFSASLYTMFQVCTGDGWSTDVVRPMFEYRTLQYKQHCLPHDADKTTVPQGRIIEAKMSQKCQDFLSEKSSPWATSDDWITCLFFVSYFIVAGYFILNIVVTVLLDEFVNAVHEERQNTAQAKDNDSKVFWSHPLDALMMSFSTFQSERDLQRRVKAIFTILDIEDKGWIGYEEWHTHSPLLDFRPPLDISADDWRDLVSSEYPEADVSRVTCEQFEAVMRAQMLAYSLRQSARKLITIHKDPIHTALPTDASFWLLASIREILTQIRFISKDVQEEFHVSLPKGLAFGGDSGFFSIPLPPTQHKQSEPEGQTKGSRRKPRAPASTDASAWHPAPSDTSIRPAQHSEHVDHSAIAAKTMEILRARQPLLDVEQQRAACQGVAVLEGRVDRLSDKMNHVIELLQGSKLEAASSAAPLSSPEPFLHA